MRIIQWSVLSTKEISISNFENEYDSLFVNEAQLLQSKLRRKEVKEGKNLWKRLRRSLKILYFDFERKKKFDKNFINEPRKYEIKKKVKPTSK